MQADLYNNFVTILKNELVPALGCTEPIAIAYATAKAREALCCEPERMVMTCSGNIIKNVKGVTVPNSDGMKGIEAAAALGALGGDPSLVLQVLEAVTKEDILKARKFLEEGRCTCHLAEGVDNLYILAELFCGEQSATVELKNTHSGITKIIKNGVTVFEDDGTAGSASAAAHGDKALLTVVDILAFADIVNISDVKDVLDRQISMNTAISEEGLRNNYGAQIGKLLLQARENNVMNRAAAKAAAGSDARMSGCSMPVVINSGSGNQGITVSLPVIEYARESGQSDEKLYRALIVANLISVHLKKHIGNLSAFCGATSAACGAACGIAYLADAGYDVICMTITNTLGNIGGMVCDGAKRSCAAKIASAVDAALMGYQMALAGQAFQPGEGLISGDIEHTIDNIGRVGRDGMESTDIEILKVMIGE